MVSQAEGKALPGATIQIVFADAGIKKTVTSSSNGSFVVPNLRVGGPYTVTISYTGYVEKKEENIILELGQNTALPFPYLATGQAATGLRMYMQEI